LDTDVSNVNWLLGQPSVDVGQQFQAGLETGRQRRQQQDRTSALRGYVANPNDQAAQQALMVADPALATQMGGQRRQDQQFQHQLALDALEQHRDRITFAGEAMQQRPVTDQAGWTALLETMRQRGYDVSDQSPTFDPSHVAGVLQAYTVLQRLRPGYTVGQGETRYRGDGSVEARGAPPPPRYYSVQAGGRLESPDIPQTQGQPPTDTSNLPRASTPADIAHLAPGSWFIAPDNLPHQVPASGGAPPPNAASTFPGVW
jgi:hypothetical protein